jgi:tetratricopeptide (TPR) repeat protein
LWSDVLATRPDDAKALVNRSLAHLAAGDDAAARVDALAALAIRPADGPALAMLGLLEARAGHDEEALAALERAEALGVRTGAVRGAMGDALRGLGRPCEAAVAYGKAARRSPSADRLPLLQGICLAECGDRDAAVLVLRGVEQRTSDASIRARAKATLDAMGPAGAGARDAGARVQPGADASVNPNVDSSADPGSQAPDHGGSEP